MADLESAAQAGPGKLDQPTLAQNDDPFSDLREQDNFPNEPVGAKPTGFSAEATPAPEPQQPENSPEELPSGDMPVQEAAPAEPEQDLFGDLRTSVPVGGEIQASAADIDPTILDRPVLGTLERIRYSFATNAYEQEKLLLSLPGVKSIEVHKTGNYIVHKQDGTSGIVDPEGMDMGDLLDMARPAVEVATATAVEAALLGTAAVQAATGVGVPTAIATIGATGAVSASAGLAAGNLGQALLGVDADPERGVVGSFKEYAWTSAFAGIMSGFAKYLGVKYQASNEAEKILKAQHQSYAKQIQNTAAELQEVHDRMKEFGVVIETPGTDGKMMTMTIDDLAVNSQETGEALDALKSSNAHKSIQESMARQWQSAYDKLASLVSGGRAKTLSEYGKLADAQPTLVDDFSGAIDDALKGENALNEKFKRMAKEAVSDAPVSTPRLRGEIIEIGRMLGIDRGETLLPDHKKLNAMSMNTFSRYFNLISSSNTGIARNLKTQLTDYIEAMGANQTGDLALEQLEYFSKQFTAIEKAAAKAEDPSLRYIASRLGFAAREGRREAMKYALKDSGKAGEEYIKHVFKMEETINAANAFSDLLNGGTSVMHQAFIKKLMKTANSDTKDTLIALATLFDRLPGKKGQDLWEMASAAMFDDVLAKASKTGTQQPTLKAIAQALNAYPTEVRQIIMKNSKVKVSDINNVLRLGQEAEKLAEQNVKVAPKGSIDAFLSNSIRILSPMVVHRVSGMHNIFNMVFGKPEITKLLTREGLEKYAQTGTVEQQRLVRNLIDWAEKKAAPLSPQALKNIKLSGKAAKQATAIGLGKGFSRGSRTTTPLEADEMRRQEQQQEMQ